MSLANNQQSKTLCKFANLLAGDLISPEDKQEILAIINTPLEDPTRITNTVLAKALRLEGFDISSRTIDRHKNEECPCYRKMTTK